MCGIFCCVNGTDKCPLEDLQKIPAKEVLKKQFIFQFNNKFLTIIFSFLQWEHCKETIAARGPDFLSELKAIPVKNWNLSFASSVLWTQGSKPFAQPFIDDQGNVLLWNGDVYTGQLVKITKKLSVLFLIIELFSGEGRRL